MNRRSVSILAAIAALLMLSAAFFKTLEPPQTTSSGIPDMHPQANPVSLETQRHISLLIGQNSHIIDYEQNELTRRIEQDLNCTLHMQVLPSGSDGLSRLQLMLNAQDELPDIISYPLSGAMMYHYGRNGSFTRLNACMENDRVTPNFHAIESTEDRTAMLAAATAADGNIYCLTKFEPTYWDSTPYRMYINRQWLNNLNLDIPETTEDLSTVLKAFRELDPNGNGAQDEIPLLTNYADGGNYGCNVLLPLINSFVYVPARMSSLSLDSSGTHVIAPQLSSGWREAMIYLHSLYKEGAILPDASFADGNDGNIFRSLLNYGGNGTMPAPSGSSVNIVGFFSCGSNERTFVGSGTDNNVNFLEYRMIPPLKNGQTPGSSPYVMYTPERYWFVTSAAADPDFCVYMGDLFYRSDYSTSARYGLRGEDWTDDPRFCSSWYAEHTELLESLGSEYVYQRSDGFKWVVLNRRLWNRDTDHFWHNQQPRYISLEDNTYSIGYYRPQGEFHYYYGRDMLEEMSRVYYSEAHPEHLLPPLNYTAEEQDVILEFQTVYARELMDWVMKFITGELDANSDVDWQKYLDAMDSLGIRSYLMCSQRAYERTAEYGILTE